MNILLETNKSLNKKHIHFSKTIKRKINIENQQEEERQKLKIKIQQKIKKSSQNLLEHLSKSNTSLSSQLKAKQQKIQQIKKLERTIYNDNFQKSKQMRTNTQRFFDKLQKQKRSTSRQSKADDNLLSRSKKKQPILQPQSNKKNKSINNNYSGQLLNQTSSNKCLPFLSFLKTSRQTIAQKQKKKLQHQKQRQKSFLQNHIQKLQLINITRNNQKIQKKLPAPTIAKIIKKQFNQEQYYAKRKNHRSFIQQSITNKETFSQSYQLKLKDKKLKKSFFLSQSIKQGDKLLDLEIKQTNKLKTNKILKQSKNQFVRKGNFRYMQKYLQNLIG